MGVTVAGPGSTTTAPAVHAAPMVHFWSVPGYAAKPKLMLAPWAVRRLEIALFATVHLVPPVIAAFMLSERSSTMSTLGGTFSAAYLSPTHPQKPPVHISSLVQLVASVHGLPVLLGAHAPSLQKAPRPQSLCMVQVPPA